MTETFVDSSYWLARLNARDVLYLPARKIIPPPRLVTTLAVLLEVMDALSAPQHRESALEFWDAIGNNSHVTVIFLEPMLIQRAIKLFRTRPDKAWSLTDCVSFVVMTERGLTEALSADHHFEQAGFRILLK